MRIGFVGLGLMGAPMARNLLAAGHQLFISTSAREPREALAAQGAVVCDTPRDAAARAQVFFSCRVTPEHSRQTFLGADGVIAAANRDLVAVDLATTTPDTAVSIGSALAQAGIAFMDAPVSGGPDGAASATLSAMVGGPTDCLERIKPALQAFTRDVFHMGGWGTGVAAKLCNNMITITTHALVAEAMVMGVKAGVDANQLYEVLRASSARSRTLERVVPNHFLKRDYQAKASLVTIMKDLQCAIDTGRELGVRLLLANVAMQAYVDAAGRGHLQKDIASVILPMEEIAGVKVGKAP